MLVCDANTLIQAAIYHVKEVASTPHMPRLSADFLRSRTKQDIRIPDIVFGEIVFGARSQKQGRMLELFLKKMEVLSNTPRILWSAAKLRRLLKRGKKHNTDCIAYMTAAAYNAKAFISWDRDFIGKKNRIKVQVSASYLLKKQAPPCFTPEEIMPKRNPKRKTGLTVDQKVMKMCAEHRARAWRRVRAIVGNDEDDQIEYMCGLARAYGAKFARTPKGA